LQELSAAVLTLPFEQPLGTEDFEVLAVADVVERPAWIKERRVGGGTSGG